MQVQRVKLEALLNRLLTAQSLPWPAASGDRVSAEISNNIPNIMLDFPWRNRKQVEKTASQENMVEDGVF